MARVLTANLTHTKPAFPEALKDYTAAVYINTKNGFATFQSKQMNITQ
jgi:hypothetical protein